MGLLVDEIKIHINAYINYLTFERNLSQKTLKAYYSDLQHLKSVWSNQNIKLLPPRAYIFILKKYYTKADLKILR
ncbi:site-specific integrase [Brevibacillus parabrevis]|uniref:site-specific integrase n=1 Tax=Brevibacillus parabrevis TaxID=54914 RepID=UPI003C6C2384